MQEIGFNRDYWLCRLYKGKTCDSSYIMLLYLVAFINHIITYHKMLNNICQFVTFSDFVIDLKIPMEIAATINL